MVRTFKEFEDVCNVILELSILSKKIVAAAYLQEPQPPGEVKRFLSCMSKLKPIALDDEESRRALNLLKTDPAIFDELQRILQLSNALEQHPWVNAATEIYNLSPGLNQAILEPRLSQLARQWDLDHTWRLHHAKSEPAGTGGFDNSTPPGQDGGSQHCSSKPNRPEPKGPNSDQVSLEARVTAFLTDRAKVLGRIPTLDQVRTAFPGEIKPTSTFYRKNPWYKTFRSALEKSLSQFDPPIEGHRNAEEDGGGVDAVFEDADYHGGSEE